jgi:UDP-N-acetylglucosamine 2-epimerase (non-hydrolysing)
MKAAPVLQALRQYGAVEQVLVHTGQHYDTAMSEVFFQQLALPVPDANLGVGSGTQSCQTAQVMLRLEPVLLEHRPDLVVVYGDVNSTVAAALVAVKLGLPVAHVEAGLRSFDRTMPEEINRLLTDQIADYLFTPSDDGDANLLREGLPATRIRLVGNVMIDTLVRLLPMAAARWSALQPHINGESFALVTLHRPSNVDDQDMLTGLIETLSEISDRLPVIFPIHPRTRKHLDEWGITVRTPRLALYDPLGYIDFLALQTKAAVVITDSGGIQEETTFLGVPCLTVRENTERPVTVTLGTNQLVGRNLPRLRAAVRAILDGAHKRGCVPPLWDGRAAERIAASLMQI